MARVLSAVPDMQTIKDRTRVVLGDGTSLLVASKIIQTFMRLGSNLILTRLLVPEAYGVVGIITSVSYILTLITDMGLRAYIIRHAHAGDELLQTVWTVRLLRNIALCAIMFFGAGAFASLYNAPEVTLAIRVCALVFLLDASSSLAFMTTERNRGVIQLTTIEFVRFATVMVVTITAAYFLRSYWAIVISMFVQPAITIFASYFILKHPPVRFRLELDHVKDLWKFWRIIIPASMVTIFLTQTNTFIMANYFPLSELGKFSLAATITAAASSLCNDYVMRIFFPRFAQTNRENPDLAPKEYYSSRRRITLLFAFGLGGIVGGAELLVRILFNDLYLGAGLYLSLLCLTPLARLITFPAEQAIIAKGFIRVALTSNIIRVPWVIIVGGGAYFYQGPIAMIAMICLAEAALIPYYFYQLRRYKLLNLSEEAIAASVALLGGLIGYGCYQGVEALIAAGRIPSF